MNKQQACLYLESVLSNLKLSVPEHNQWAAALRVLMQPDAPSVKEESKKLVMADEKPTEAPKAEAPKEEPK